MMDKEKAIHELNEQLGRLKAIGDFSDRETRVDSCESSPREGLVGRGEPVITNNGRE
jgi:hypothetical protein